MELNPYLTFNGNCKKALEFYKNILGGEFEGGIKTYADGGEHMPFKPEHSDKVMHVHLKTDNFSILASDNMSDKIPFTKGNNFSLSLNLNNIIKAQEIFEALSQDGNVVMPLADVFWGGQFGMLVDQFEIQWMVSTPH